MLGQDRHLPVSNSSGALLSPGSEAQGAAGSSTSPPHPGRDALSLPPPPVGLRPRDWPKERNFRRDAVASSEAILHRHLEGRGGISVSLTVCVGIHGSKRRACTLLGTEWPTHSRAHRRGWGQRGGRARSRVCVPRRQAGRGGRARRPRPPPTSSDAISLGLGRKPFPAPGASRRCRRVSRSLEPPRNTGLRQGHLCHLGSISR